MDNKRIKKVAIILSASVLSAGAIAAAAAGATYAYFTATAKTNIHVKAGSLDVLFERTAIAGVYPSQDGSTLVNKEADATDYKNLSADPSFVHVVANAMPGMGFTTTYKVTNPSATSSVTFDYYLSVLNLEYGVDDHEEPTEASIELAKKLVITVAPDGGDTTNIRTFTADKIPSPVAAYKDVLVKTSLAPGESHTFDVFLGIGIGDMSGDDNVFQMGEVKFDLQVNAVQSIEGVSAFSYSY